MKTDNYLNLCIEQAANSPLRYRHGAIVVRGGKVIGQGYNDYRSGFDGGALKTGRLPLRASSAATMNKLKKHESKQKPDAESIAETSFMPFEQINGGGKLVNTPLSMHAEMMAIHSALTASSALVSSAVSSEKPYFKLPGGSKQKARLRRDAIKSYVEIVCKAALVQYGAKSCRAQSEVQQRRFEQGASKSKLTESCSSGKGVQGGRGLACRKEYSVTEEEERQREATSQHRQQLQHWPSRTAQTIFT